MSVAEKAAALLEAITPTELDALPPAARQRFAALCLRIAELAEPRADAPKAGVLSDLRRGARAE
jgi:hypothetical protein